MNNNTPLRELRRRGRVARRRLLRAFRQAVHQDLQDQATSAVKVVQVGACDGTMGDPLADAIERWGWHGLLIEPVPHFFAELRQKYKDNQNIALVNCAIGERVGDVTIHVLSPAAEARYPKWARGLASFDRGHIQGTIPERDLTAVRVRMRPLAAVVEEARFDDADVLVVDFEGAEMSVFASIDVTRFRPKVIDVETRHLTAAAKRELRGNRDFASLDAYRRFVDQVVARRNAKREERLRAECAALRPLPARRTTDSTETVARVTRTGGFMVKQVFYSAPARLVGHRLRVHLYDDRVEAWLGATHVVTHPRRRSRRAGKRVPSRVFLTAPASIGIGGSLAAPPPTRPVTRPDANRSSRLSRYSYETKSLAVAANQPFNAWKRVFPNEAMELLRQAVHHSFGAFGDGVAVGTKLRHDHGSQFVADDFQAELAFLGLESSPAFVREPEGNGWVERFIRVLKENLLWLRHSYTVEDLRRALHAFKDAYNQGWILQRHGYRTPAQVRAEQPAVARAA